MRLPALFVFSLLLFVLHAASGQGPSSPPLITVRAELIKTLRSNKVTGGDQVIFRTTEIFQRPDCIVPADTNLLGKVEAIDRSGTGTHKNTLALSFSRLPCKAPISSTLFPSWSRCSITSNSKTPPSSASPPNTAAWSVPLAHLGFQPRPEQPMMALRTDASVHALGEDQLLLTFALHTLIKRSQAESMGARPRKIRAVVLSRENGRVLLMKDWTVPQDSGAYVWSFGPGRVVAQVGNDLVTFGPDLAEEQRFPLPGPLVFLSAAPEGELALVATLHEKHSKGEHEALVRFLGPDQPIDENYDLMAVDKNLHAVGSRLLYAQPAQPAVLRSAMVAAHQGRAGPVIGNSIRPPGAENVRSSPASNPTAPSQSSRCRAICYCHAAAFLTSPAPPGTAFWTHMAPPA